MPIKLKNLKPAADAKSGATTDGAKEATSPAKSPPSEEAVELMKAIHQRRTEESTPVSRPGDVFKVLTEQLGFQRTPQHDEAAHAREFVVAVRRYLVSQKKRSPTYDEVLAVMRKLGYERAVR